MSIRKKIILPPRYRETFKQLNLSPESKEKDKLMWEYMDIVFLKDKIEQENAFARFFRKVKKWLASAQK